MHEPNLERFLIAALHFDPWNLKSNPSIHPYLIEKATRGYRFTEQPRVEEDLTLHLSFIEPEHGLIGSINVQPDLATRRYGGILSEVWIHYGARRALGVSKTKDLEPILVAREGSDERHERYCARAEEQLIETMRREYERESRASASW